jgi:putative ABC transport system permease protein
MTWTAFRALLSHWRYRPLQLATLIVGVALATALWSGVQAINAEARASYGRAASVLEQNNLAQLTSPDGRGVPTAIFARLRRAGLDVSPVIEGEYRFGTTRIRLIGIDPLTMPTEDQAYSMSGPAALFDFFAGRGQLIVSAATARRLTDTEGMAVKISTDMPDGAAFVDIGVADRLLDRQGLLSRIVVAPKQAVDAAVLRSIAPELVMRMAGAEADLSRLTDSFHLNLTAFGFLAFVVGLFIVYSATGLSFEQRRGTFRTLRAVGVSLRDLTVMLLAEMAMFGLAAGLLGIVIGYLVASTLLPGVAATLRGLYGADVAGTIALRPEWWAAGLAMAFLGTGLSSAQSLWRVWTMPILSAAQAGSWYRASRRSLGIQAMAGVCLLIGAAIFAGFGSGLVAGFALLGMLLIGAALVLPALLSATVTAAVGLSRSALSMWFWADTRLQLPALSLALMALLLALSANVGVGTMVSSFRLTFLGWLDQRLAAELYVTARDETEASRMREWLSTRSQAVLPIWSVEGDVAGKQLQIFGVADHPTYRDHWPLIRGTSDTWAQIADGRGALVNEQFWRGQHVELGQNLALPGGWEVKIVGVYSDYGNPQGQVIVGVDALAKHYPAVQKLRYGIRVAADSAPELKRQLIEEFGLPENNIVDQAVLKRQSRAIFEQTFAVTGALNVLTLAVAGFAMFSSMLTLSNIRLPQLAPVWAMGLRRRDLALLEIVRTLALWFATFCAAIPVGLCLAWVLLAIVNVEAFGWRLPMTVFPLDWLKLGLVALVAALVSILLPVRRLATVDPADLLRVFANER